MSMYRGHLIGGFIFYACTIALVSIWQDALIYSIPGLLATLAGSLFPDIDVRSTGQNLFLKLLFLAVALCIFLQASLPLMVLLIFSVFPLVFPHRGLFHNLYFIMGLVSLCAGSLLYSMPGSWRSIILLAGYFLLGVLSHLILDKGMRKTFHHSR